MTAPLKVAIFGLLGSGNLGNQASFEAMLQFLQTEHPETEIACVCSGPEAIERDYRIPSIAINWSSKHQSDSAQAKSLVLKAVGKVVDVVRTYLWVRTFDVVIVPGMGVFETTLPVRPWGFPFALFLVSFWGKLCGKKVAFVSVGANVPHGRATRWLLKYAAKLAYYRSFRDIPSRRAVAKMGVDTSRDLVFPDLAFALSKPPRIRPANRTKTAGVGVMAYFGASSDRSRAHQIHATYVEQLLAFLHWLLDNDYRVRLLVGDVADEAVGSKLDSQVRQARPDLMDDWLRTESASSHRELMHQISAVDVVIASRYHNVVFGLMLSKPTISISYALKNDVLMESMGMREFCQPIQQLDARGLAEQLRVIQNTHRYLETQILRQVAHSVQLLRRQNAILSTVLF